MNICFAGGFGHYSHAADTKENIVGVLTSQEDTKDYIEFCRDKKKYTDYRKMLDTENPDAVVIDSIFDGHFEMAKYALDKGIHIFIEKPVCLKLSEIDILRKTAEKTNTLIFGMFTTRFEAPFYTLKQLAESGVIGKIKLINGQKTYILGQREPFYYQPEKFGNTFSWVGIHSVEQAIWLCGEKLTESAYFHRKSDSVNLDESAVAICKFGDVLATFTVDYLRPEGSGSHGDDRLRVVGTKGILEVIGGKLYLTADGKANEEQKLITPMKIFDNFIGAIKGEVKNLCTNDDTLAATEAVLTISGL